MEACSEEQQVKPIAGKTYIEVIDDGDSKAVSISQSIGQVIIDPDEWEAIRDAVDFSAIQCRNGAREK